MPLAIEETSNSEAINGRAPPMFDAEIERLFVAALLADPSRHDSCGIALQDLQDPHAIEAFAALANARAKLPPGLEPDLAAIRDQALVQRLARVDDAPRWMIDRNWEEIARQHELDWLERIIALDVTPPIPFAGWVLQILRFSAMRAKVQEDLDERIRAENEIDDFALRDAEPPAPPEQKPPIARWIVPLDSFLGDEEPDDDDSTDWIIRDIVPRGEAGIFAGPPKCGKTWAMLGIGIDVSLGRDWLNKFPNTMGGPSRVLCLAFEDGQRRLRKRVWELARARGLTPNDPAIRAHLSVGREPLSLPGDERAFAAELKAWKPTLVLIDNLTRVMSGDQNAIKDAKRFGDMWVKLCSDVGAAVVFLHHTNKVGPIAPGKRNEGDPFELIRGSGDLVASARHLVLMRPLESPDATKLSDVRMRGNLDLQREDFVLGFDRSQIVNRWTAQLSYRGETESVHDEIAAKRREKQAARKESRAGRGGDDSANSVDERVYAKLVNLVAGGGRELCTLEQLRQTCGVRQQEVRPALDRLVHAGRVRADAVKRFEGTSWRTRAIFVPTEGGG